MNRMRTAGWTIVSMLTLALLPSGGSTHPDAARRARLVDRAAESPVVGAGAVIAERDRIERETIASLIADHRHAGDDAWRARLTEAIFEQSLAVGLDPLLVAAIAARESSFRARVVSRAGAVGLMQIRPFVGRDLASRSALDWNGAATLHEPETNVRLGALYYVELHRRFAGDDELALAAYHRGPTRLARQLESGCYDGSAYADRVRALYRELDRRRARQLGAVSVPVNRSV